MSDNNASLSAASTLAIGLASSADEPGMVVEALPSNPYTIAPHS